MAKKIKLTEKPSLGFHDMEDATLQDAMLYGSVTRLQDAAVNNKRKGALLSASLKSSADSQSDSAANTAGNPNDAQGEAAPSQDLNPAFPGGPDANKKSTASAGDDRSGSRERHDGDADSEDSKDKGHTSAAKDTSCDEPPSVHEEPKNACTPCANNDHEDNHDHGDNGGCGHTGSGLAIVMTGVGVALDESVGLQNAVATSVVGDSNDNDIVTRALPSPFSARLAALGAPLAINAAQSGYNGVAGSNVFTVSGADVVLGMALTNASGHVINGLDSGLTTIDGHDIKLYTDTQDNNIVLGKTSTGELAFAVYLEETSMPTKGGSLWTVLYVPIFHPDSSSPDESLDLSGKLFVTVEGVGLSSLGDITPGQHLFFMAGNSESAIVVTGRDPASQSAGQHINAGDRVNVSRAGGETSIGINNQMINPPAHGGGDSAVNGSDGLVFTFVKGANPAYTGSQLSEAEARIEENIQFDTLKNVNVGLFKIGRAHV